MSEDLPEKFMAENDLVLEFARQSLLIGVPGIPDPGLAHETECCLMDNHGFLTLCVGPEEDRCSEDPLERRHQSPILRPALLHAEGVEHFRCAAKPNHTTLLADRERS